MPFDRPALADLMARSQADAETRLTGGVPVPAVSNIAIMARVLAGAVHGLYGYLDWIARQILPDTADADMLVRHAGVRGMGLLAATYAAGTATLSGTAGTAVPLGTQLRATGGAVYATTAAVSIAGLTAAPVQALVAGAAGNAAAGTALTLVSAVPGVSSAAVVAAGGLTGGADQESVEALRTRYLARIRQPPQGGSATDYEDWAFGAHPDITRVFVDAGGLGAGTVVVRMMTDDATSDGIPGATVVAAVQAALDVARPVCAAVTALAPVAAPLAVTLAIAPDTTAVRAAVTAALADLIRREAVPGGTLSITHIHEAISTAAGESDHELSAPAAGVVAATGYITTMGVITWL